MSSKIPLSCKACAKRYQVPDSYAGQKFKCKGCGEMIRVPGARPVTRSGPAAGSGTRSGRPPTRSRTATRRTTSGTAVPNSAQNKTLLLLSGIGCVVLIGAIVFVFVSGNGNDEKPRKRSTEDVSEEPARVPDAEPPMAKKPEAPGLDPLAGAKDEPEEAPKPEPKKETVVAKKDEPKPAPKKKEEPKGPERPRIPNVELKKIPHLESTPAEVRTEIDEKVETLADPWAKARDLTKAESRLKELGDASVPALLSKMVDLKFDEEDARLAMPKITTTLQEITKARNSMICRIGMQRGDPTADEHMCKLKRAEWFDWYKRYSKLNNK